MASKKEVDMESKKTDDWGKASVVLRPKELSNKKDKWDKASVVLRPLGGLLAALAIAGIGYFGHHYLNERQVEESKMRLYTELISNREEAESALRKDMFTSIMGTFLKPETAKLRERVLQLELLAYNFHECLNLMPLFLHLNQQIDEDTTAEDKDKKSYRKRLHKVAREINSKQIAVLEGAGNTKEILIDFSDTTKIIHQEKYHIESDTLEMYKETFVLKAPTQVGTEKDTIGRHYTLTVFDVDITLKEINVRLEIRTPKVQSELKTLAEEFEDDEFDKKTTTVRDYTEPDELLDEGVPEELKEFPDDEFTVGDSALIDSTETDSIDDEFRGGEVADFREATFWVGPFDFPMIDNTRLSNDQRCAVVLKEFKYPEAILTVICDLIHVSPRKGHKRDHKQHASSNGEILGLGHPGH